jgi:signal transduction histidine kinase
MSTPTHVRALRDAPERTHWNEQRIAMATALEAAADRALAQVAQSGSIEAAAASKLRRSDVISVLADAIVCRVHDGVTADLALYAWTPEAPTLLAALRQELLCGRARADWMDADLLRTVTAIEQLSTALEGDVSVRFAQQYAGRESQQRLIDMAHDMRSPLNAILLLVERLQQRAGGPVTGAQEHQLALVYSAAFGLSSLVSDLMETARGGSRLLGETPRAFSLSAMLRSVRDVVQPVAAERKLSLRFSSPRDDRRFGQESAIHRVLLNLVTNALKVTTVGSVTVEVRQLDDTDVLQFVVEDTGPGLTASQSDDIFAATSNAPNDRESFSSHGLGLAICRKLVTAMRGELRASSRVGHGTRMTFTLPLPRAD